MNFYKWAKDYKNHKNSFEADFAADMEADSNFPRQLSSVEELEAYLFNVGACTEAQEAAKAMVSRWLALNKQLDIKAIMRDSIKRQMLFIKKVANSDHPLRNEAAEMIYISDEIKKAIKGQK